MGEYMTTPSFLPEIAPQITRQAKLNTILRSSGLACLILNAGPSLTYLTGLHFHLSERPVLVIFSPDRVPTIVLPELELEKLKNIPYELKAFPYGEDPLQWKNIFQQAVQAAKLVGERNAVEPRQFRFLEFRLLHTAAPDADFIPADDCISKLRLYKDENEIAAMRQAAKIAEQALAATLPFIKIS